MANDKKEATKKKPTQLWTLYETKGDVVSRKKPFCPKCKEKTFLGVHKDRKHCGKCGYIEVQKETPQNTKKDE